MYFVRLQCGHLKEAIDLIQEICNDEELSSRVERCSANAQDCFRQLEACLQDGLTHDRYIREIKKIRNKIGFHYDKKMVKLALPDRASRAEGRPSRINTGDDIKFWRYNLADDIADTILCRQIWGIPEDVQGADLREAADLKSDFPSDLCKSFLDFCSDFIISYIREHATI
jgi:hypothetical protein